MAIRGIPNCWTGIWNGTMEWKMEWNTEHTQLQLGRVTYLWGHHRTIMSKFSIAHCRASLSKHGTSTVASSSSGALLL